MLCDMRLENKSIKTIIFKHIKLKSNVKVLTDKIDSLQFLKLIFFLEKKFKIKFSEKDFSSEKIQNIDELANIIKKKLNSS